MLSTTLEAIMKTISAAEANRHFSEVLRAATQGQTILITSRGRPVATLGLLRNDLKSVRQPRRQCWRV
jgi:antitoxin (DNA-binding transcriptional repressor) of toxin-antitoxin stability system